MSKKVVETRKEIYTRMVELKFIPKATWKLNYLNTTRKRQRLLDSIKKQDSPMCYPQKSNYGDHDMEAILPLKSLHWTWLKKGPSSYGVKFTIFMPHFPWAAPSLWLNAEWVLNYLLGIHMNTLIGNLDSLSLHKVS
jgi:hypothetical protein